MLHREITTDVVVVGGGLAGVSAAISAARLGRTVSLIGNRPVLGGNSSSEVRVWVCGATAHGMQRSARETGVIGELYVENQYRNPEGNPIHWDEVVLDAVRAEPLIGLHLNTDVRIVDAGLDDGEQVIRSVTGWTMGAEIETEFRATYFVDATGDGLIGHLAGADYRLGREAQAEFGEEWAPEEADTEYLGSTILFYTKDTGRPVRYVAPDSTKDIASTAIPTTRIIRSGDSGARYWWIEWGGELDIVQDNEVIRDELRSVIFGIWDFIKNSGRFDADTLDLEWVGTLPGKREYRRFLGDYVLTQNDILDQTHFHDQVAFGGWSIDLHPVEGMYADHAGALQRFSDGIYGIPFRCYYSRNVANLLMAGRDISATHVAFGSSRVMATCAAGGEAAGTGAALAIELGVRPRELSGTYAERLQQLLLRQDASIFGVRNIDQLDRARGGRVTASSTLECLNPPDGSKERDHLLDSSLGILLPVDPHLDGLHVLLRVSADTTLPASLWTTGQRQNAVPIAERTCVEIPLTASEDPQWVCLPLRWHPEEPENVVVVLGPNDAVSVVLAEQTTVGVLALPHHPETDGDPNVAVEGHEPLVQWPVRPLRGWTPRLHLDPPTAAFGPDKAVGGYQRPYGGPQLWMSAAIGDQPEWLQVEWDVPCAPAEVRVVFDDDVDTELNTLHHHRSPHLVFPQLVRDYRIEARRDGRWRTLVEVSDNRRRQRVHRIESPSAADAVRVTVLATNGDRHARIVGLRVYE